LRRLGLLGRPLRAADVGFKIGPRINAAGRLALADTAIDLFGAASEEEAWAICADLDHMNAERQEIERLVREEASKQIAGGERILVLAGEGWHKGVLGLSAGRIAQQWHRPALMISIDGEVCVGSGRSIPAINLHAQLQSAAGLFTRFGGHEFACGFSLPARNLEELRQRLTDQFALLDESLFARQATVDGYVALSELDRDFVMTHELLQPFGAGNEQPLFAIRNARVTAKRVFAEECCELSLENGEAKGTAVVWPSVKDLLQQVNGAPLDLLVRIEPDSWSATGGRLAVADVRPAAAE
jgi:single-stranded-DNA-specific exonuclease